MSAETAYAFRHVVLRDAAYQMQLPTARTELHGLAYHALDECTPPAERATVADEVFEHAVLAGEQNGETAFEYLKLAASWAAEHYHVARAIELLGALLDHPLATVADRLHAAHLRSSQLLHAGRPKEAEADLRGALELAERHEPDSRGRLLAALGGVLMESGRHAQADDWFVRAIDSLRAAGDDRYLGICLTNRAILFRHIGQPADVFSLLEEALEINRRTGNRRFEGIALSAMAGSRRTHGAHDEAEALYRKALEIFQSNGDRREEAQTWGNLANVFINSERGDEAEVAYFRALRGLRELGALRGEAIVLGNLGNLLWTRGLIGRCIAAQRRCVEILTQIEDRLLLPAFRSMLAGHLIRLGELDAANAELQQGLSECDSRESMAALDYLLPCMFSLHIAQAGEVWGVHDHTPDPAGVQRAREVLQRMRQSADGRHTESTAVLRGEMQIYVRKLQLVDSGKSDGLFNGSDLKRGPLPRRALLARLQALAPERLEKMKATAPALYQSYFAEVEQDPEPDWRDNTLPG